MSSNSLANAVLRRVFLSPWWIPENCFRLLFTLCNKTIQGEYLFFMDQQLWLNGLVVGKGSSRSQSLLPQSWCRHLNRSNWRRVCGTFGWRWFRGWRRSASILEVKSALVVVVVLMVVVTFIINGTVIISDKQSVYYHFIFVLGQTFALISLLILLLLLRIYLVFIYETLFLYHNSLGMESLSH